MNDKEYTMSVKSQTITNAIDKFGIALINIILLGGKQQPDKNCEKDQK